MYISFKHFINDCSVKPVYGDYIYNLHSKIIDKNTVNCLYTSPDSNVSINIILDDIAEEVIVSAVGLASGLLKIAFSFPKFEEVVYKLDEKYLPNGVSTQAINSKMNTTNPVGTGSFSMNRKEGIEIGDYSMTSGYGSVANHFAENVSGQYNIYEHPKFWVDTLVDETYTTLTFFKGYNYYYSNEYSFDQSTGIYKLINATYVSKDDIYQLKNSYIILVNKRFEPNITEGSRLMFVSYTRNTSTNYYTATGNVFQSVPDTSKKGTYTHIVGNGTSDTARSNAHTLDWEGNAWYSGDVYVGSTSGTNRDEGSKKLATVEEVQELASQISPQPYVAQTEAPEDKNLLWLDLDDESDDEGLADAIQAAIADVKNVAIPVPEVAKVGQTIVVKEIDENGKPIAWEAVNFPSGDSVPEKVEFTIISEGIIPAGSDGTTAIDTGVTWADLKDYDWFEIAIGTNVSTSGQKYYFFNRPTPPEAWRRFMLVNGYIGKARFKKIANGVYEWFSQSNAVAVSGVIRNTSEYDNFPVALNGPLNSLVDFKHWLDTDKFYIYPSVQVPSDQTFNLCGIRFK